MSGYITPPNPPDPGAWAAGLHAFATECFHSTHYSVWWHRSKGQETRDGVKCWVWYLEADETSNPSRSDQAGCRFLCVSADPVEALAEARASRSASDD